MPSINNSTTAQYYDQLYRAGAIDLDGATSVLQEIQESSGSEVCAVCFEPSSDMITPFRCGHHLHRDCMITMQSTGLPLRCPLCRNMRLTEERRSLAELPAVEIRGELDQEETDLTEILTNLLNIEGNNDEERQAQINSIIERIEAINDHDFNGRTEQLTNALERFNQGMQAPTPRRFMGIRLRNQSNENQQRDSHQERTLIAREIAGHLNSISPLNDLVNDVARHESHQSSQINHLGASIELLSRRVHHEVSRLHEQHDSMRLNNMQATGNNEEREQVVTALFNQLSNKIDELERQIAQSGEENPNSDRAKILSESLNSIVSSVASYPSLAVSVLTKAVGVVVEFAGLLFELSIPDSDFPQESDLINYLFQLTGTVGAEWLMGPHKKPSKIHIYIAAIRLYAALLGALTELGNNGPNVVRRGIVENRSNFQGAVWCISIYYLANLIMSSMSSLDFGREGGRSADTVNDVNSNNVCWIEENSDLDFLRDV